MGEGVEIHLLNHPLFGTLELNSLVNEFMTCPRWRAFSVKITTIFNCVHTNDLFRVAPKVLSFCRPDRGAQQVADNVVSIGDLMRLTHSWFGLYRKLETRERIVLNFR